jgi:DNA-directed RNA polymerase alpha subunit
MQFDEMTFRSKNTLRMNGVLSAEDLEGKTVEDLKRFRAMGLKALEETKTMMLSSGYEIRDGRFVRKERE